MPGVVIPTGPFTEPLGYRFRGTGIIGTIVAGTTNHIEYAMPETRRINAVHLLLHNHSINDKSWFQVVDKDGLFYPAGTVLDEFATEWNVDPTICSQRTEKIEYPATIQQGLYVRIKYQSTGGQDVTLKANLYLHKVPS